MPFPDTEARLMYPRRVERWRTRFGGWVSSYTARALAREVGVHPASVYRWLRGVDVPRPAIATRIVAVSGGLVTLEDIFSHRQEIHHGADGKGSMAR